MLLFRCAAKQIWATIAQMASSSLLWDGRVQAAFCSQNNYTLICDVKWVLGF